MSGEIRKFIEELEKAEARVSELEAQREKALKLCIEVIADTGVSLNSICDALRSETPQTPKSPILRGYRDLCPQPVWDGPYRFTCGKFLDKGVCGTHGPQRESP